jgi:PmbA protein
MVWIANTKGLRGSYRQNYCAAFTAPLAADGEGAVQHGEAEACRSFEKLNTEEIAKTAARITLSRRGAVRPRTGTYTVVFENRAAERLIGLTLGYFSAKAVDENRSPLKGKLGQAVFSKNLSLLDDPFFTSGTGCRPFDEEGYPARKTTLVENGTLKNFLTNSVYARKMNLPHTASASRSPSTDLGVSTSNVLVRPGTQTLEELLASDAKVILVTDMLGFAGFRSVSGDFSLPMEGFLYENGKMSRPLKDFLISGNILNVLGAVDAVGNDTRNPVSGVVSPSLLVRGLNVAGQS